MIFELYTEYPPTVNNYYVKTQRGVYISQKGRKFRDQLSKDAFEQGVHNLSIPDKVSIEVVMWAPDKRKRDVDNILKPLLDAMTQAKIWNDDCQIDQLHVYRGDVVFGGRLYVKVSEAAPRIPEGMEKLLDTGE